MSPLYCHLLSDSSCFLRKGVTRDDKHNGDIQNGFTSCFAGQTGSASVFLPVIEWFMRDDEHNSEVPEKTARKMLTLPVWPILTLNLEVLFSALLPCKITTDKTYINQYSDGVSLYNYSLHKREDNSYQISESVMKIVGLEVSISHSMCA